VAAQLRHSNATALNFVIKQSAARLDAQQRMRHILATHTHTLSHTLTHPLTHNKHARTHADTHAYADTHTHARTHARANNRARASSRSAAAARFQQRPRAGGLTCGRHRCLRHARPMGAARRSALHHVAVLCCNIFGGSVLQQIALRLQRADERGALEYSGEGGRKSQCRCKYRTGTRLGTQRW
jgi:hypothetical protein